MSRDLGLPSRSALGRRLIAVDGPKCSYAGSRLDLWEFGDELEEQSRELSETRNEQARTSQPKMR